MEKWPQVKIGDVCIVERGGSPRPINKYTTDSEDGINWIKIGDTNDSMYITSTAQKIIPEGMKKSRYVQPGDFLLSNSMSFGRPYILKIGGCIHDGWLVLRDKGNFFDKRFLYYYLGAPITYQKFKSLAVGGVVNNLNSAMVRNVEIPLPPLDEQRKIAAVLDKVSDLIAKRRQQLDKLDELVKSQFIAMFGDPVQNPLSWDTKPLLEMGYCKNGMNFRTGDRGIEMHCLGVGDFKDFSVIDGTDNLPTISLNEAPPEESMLQDGDIVFVRSNGNKDLVGRCLVVYTHNTPTTYSGFCIRYRITGREVNTAYLLRVLKTDSMRRKMAGRGANIQNLNQQILATLDIPTPPLMIQEQFAAFVEQTDKSKLAIQKSLEKLEILKKSLMQKYFG